MAERIVAQAAQSECGHFMRVELIQKIEGRMKELQNKKMHDVIITNLCS
jgi:hypothetical protein